MTNKYPAFASSVRCFGGGGELHEIKEYKIPKIIKKS